MTNKQKFIDYVKNGGEKPICSLQIGAGAGYDAKLAGKTWLHEATIEDTISACERYDMLPLYNFGVDILAPTDIKWNRVFENLGEKLRWYDSIETPFGTLSQETFGFERMGCTRVKDPVSAEEDWDRFEWLLDAIIDGKHYDRLTEQLSSLVEMIGDRGAVDFQWGMQPYELFSFPSNLTTMFYAMDEEERFFRLMDKCLEISKKIVRCVAEAKGDFCFLGGPAAEMVNPYIYENYMVPYGKMITDEVHRNGMLVYSHVCSPVEPFLTKGYFNQLGIDLFETLSMPPVGNVQSIEDAFTKIDKSICTRGNVGIDALINATPDEIKRTVFHIMEEAVKAGRKHMVAASDYLVYECKEENVKALCEAVAEFKL